MEAPKQTHPTLKRLAEFETILKSYAPSQSTLATLQATKLVLLVGPTAAGRNTLMDILVSTGRYHYILSDTTRPPRTNNGVMEQNGKEYWFKHEDEFLDGLKAGNYLEAAVIHRQQVSGLSATELERAHTLNKIALDEIEIDGTAHIKKYKPETLCIFLLPPSFDVWMQRLRGRGNMSETEMNRRLQSADTEIKAALKEDYYQFVINNEIHDAAKMVDELANGTPSDAGYQDKARAHAQQLASDVHSYLNL